MKLVTYLKQKVVSCGVLTDEGIVDIPSSLRLGSGQAWKGSDAPGSVKEVLEAGPAGLAKLAKLVKSAKNVTPLDSVKLLAPIPRPGKVLALAGNYAEHIKEAGMKLGLSDSPRVTTVPRPFLMPGTAVIGPGDQIPWPVYSETIDYELELAVVIGRPAPIRSASPAIIKNTALNGPIGTTHIPHRPSDRCWAVTPDQAPEFIAGYTIVNDVSARTVTFTKNRAKRPWDEFYDWLNGKWADGFCPMGPFLLTADEIEDVQNLDMELSVNGQVRQKANTSQMIHPVADIVSFLSHLMTLEPGDVIATGTPSGVGMATGNFLKAGDRIDSTIQNLGTLTNTLGPRPKKFYEPLK